MVFTYIQNVNININIYVCIYIYIAIVFISLLCRPTYRPTYPATCLRMYIHIEDGFAVAWTAQLSSYALQ